MKSTKTNSNKKYILQKKFNNLVIKNISLSNLVKTVIKMKLRELQRLIHYKLNKIKIEWCKTIFY